MYNLFTCPSEARVEARDRAEAKPGRPGAGPRAHGPGGRPQTLRPQIRRGLPAPEDRRGPRSGGSKMAVAAAVKVTFLVDSFFFNTLRTLAYCLLTSKLTDKKFITLLRMPCI